MYPREDFQRDYVKKYFLKLTIEERREVLERLPPEKRQELLQVLPPEVRLASLSVERIRLYLDQLATERLKRQRKRSCRRSGTQAGPIYPQITRPRRHRQI